jgi:hypothetical protein
MLGIIGLHVPLVVVERDGPVGDIEGEIAISAVAVLPAAMGLAEEAVDQGLDGVVDRQALSVDLAAAPDWAADLDGTGREGDDFVGGLGFDILDLAAVAVTLEGDDDDGDARRS